jgi:hypothetical protein
MRIAERRYDAVKLVIESAFPLTVRLHQFYLPAWRAALGAAPVPVYPSGELGLVTSDLPAGEQSAAFSFGPAPGWRAGWALCLTGALLWAALAWHGARDRRGRWLRVIAVGLPLLVFILALNSEGLGQRRWTPELPAGGAPCWAMWRCWSHAMRLRCAANAPWT